MSEYVLDASAILTVLNSEKGLEVVRPLLSRSVVSTVNLAEVVVRLAAVGMPEHQIRESLGLLGLESVEFDEEQAFRCGLLYIRTKGEGLSLGDRACLTLAARESSIAVTADQAWRNVDVSIQILLIR